MLISSSGGCHSKQCVSIAVSDVIYTWVERVSLVSKVALLSLSAVSSSGSLWVPPGSLSWSLQSCNLGSPKLRLLTSFALESRDAMFCAERSRIEKSAAAGLTNCGPQSKLKELPLHGLAGKITWLFCLKWRLSGCSCFSLGFSLRHDRYRTCPTLC